MSIASHPSLLGGALSVLVVCALNSDALGQASPPDFTTGAAWLGGGTFIEVPGSGPTPVRQDPRYRYVPNNTNEQPTYRIGDVSNPNLKPWVAAAMKKDNDEVIAGKYAYTARSSCAPGGVPGFMLFPAQPIYFIQAPNKVLMLYQGNAEVRRIHMNVPHTANPKPSFYGESVGRYEGDTLVIDTIGLNNKTVLDAYRTPHSDKLHVTERWRIIEGNSILEVTYTVEDPDTFEKPWTAKQRFRRVPTAYTEEVCIEGNLVLHQWELHIADKADF